MSAFDSAALGEACKQVRNRCHYTRKEVAQEIGCSTQLIYMFEEGKTRSLIVFYWYLLHGFDVRRIAGVTDYE